MSESAMILIVGDSPGIRKMVEACLEAIKGCEIMLISSLNNFDTFIGRHSDRRIPIVVVDYAAATEGMTGEGISLSSAQRLELVKTAGIKDGATKRFVIGVSGLEPFRNQLTGFGCDKCVGEASLIGSIEEALKATSDAQT